MNPRLQGRPFLVRANAAKNVTEIDIKTGEIKEICLDNFSEQFMSIKLDDELSALEDTII